MRFDWDPKKSVSNIEKHGISFEDAITAFDDPFAFIQDDEEHSTPDESRAKLIGQARPGVLVVVFTVREKGSVTRLISARLASKKERKLYVEGKRI